MIALACAACGGEVAPAKGPSDQPPPEAISKVTENGPVKATVQVWPAKPTHGDAIHLRLTIEAQAGVTVVAPFEDEALGRFQVSAYDHDTKRRDDGATVEVQRYTLDSPGSGKQRIPPLRLEVSDARGKAPGTTTELLTEEIALEIAAIDPARASEPLAAARGPLPFEVGGTRWWLVALIVIGGAGVLVGGVAAYRAMRQASVRRARVSAYEDAVARLAALEQRGAPDASSADAWFVELSGIVRRYLEGRFGVRAPELTTEEFMHEARRAGGLGGEHRELLTAFLERCDRVKFAGYRPDSDESLATLKAARAFVEDTRLREAEAA
jgi:hypothetical protein